MYIEQLEKDKKMYESERGKHHIIINNVNRKSLGIKGRI